MRAPSLAVAVASIALSAVPTLASATDYKYTDLGTLGGTYSYAYGLNNAGQAVGNSSLSGEIPQHATLWSSSGRLDLGALGGTYSIAFAINANGQIAGNIATTTDHSATYPYRAVRWDGTTATPLNGNETYARSINGSGQIVGESVFADSAGPRRATRWDGVTPFDLGGFNSTAFDINDAGTSVGYNSFDGGGTSRAAMWNGGLLVDLGTLGGSTSAAYAINESGQAAGFSVIASSFAYHATRWDGSTAIDLGTLGGTYSTAFGINDFGQVVGFSDVVGDARRHATLWNGTSPKDLNEFLDASTVEAGWYLDNAKAINNNGWIVGLAKNSLTGAEHAFLLTPIPEAEICAMTLGGLVAAASFRRTRRRKMRQPS